MAGAAAADGPAFTAVAGVDFTSRPRRAKPITVALGRVEPLPPMGGDRGDGATVAVRLESVELHAGFDAFAAWLTTPGPWLGVFDLPFGLPRELVETLGWPLDWPALIEHYAGLTRREVRDTFAAFCAARPTGAKFAHRACDGPAGSSPSMKWVNPPVAYMLHAGVPLLVEAGLHLPGVMPGQAAVGKGGQAPRVALEGYPGLLARELVGAVSYGMSYKSDDRRRQTSGREQARQAIVDALRAGRTRLAVRLEASSAQCRQLVADPAGDVLDAVLCLVQAAWAAVRPGYGLPAGIDPLEGWIVSAGTDATP